MKYIHLCIGCINDSKIEIETLAACVPANSMLRWTSLIPAFHLIQMSGAVDYAT
jgi:hypothetical protein